MHVEPVPTRHVGVGARVKLLVIVHHMWWTEIIVVGTIIVFLVILPIVGMGNELKNQHVETIIVTGMLENMTRLLHVHRLDGIASMIHMIVMPMIGVMRTTMVAKREIIIVGAAM